MNRLKIKKLAIPLVTILFLVPLLTISAKVFVDWRGKFKVEYPDSWSHVPYEKVNDFLIGQGIDPDYFEYNAVLASDSAGAFEEGAYIFITLELVGELGNRQIDSTLRVIAAEYGQSEVSKAPALSGNIGLKEGIPVYDGKAGTVVTKSTINTAKGPKILLDFRKIYDQGLAVFLCYTYEKSYINTYKEFFGIVNSFTTEDLHAEDNADSVKIVDLSQREEPSSMPSDTIMKELAEADDGEAEGATKKEIAEVTIPIAVVFLVLAIIVIRRKKRR